MLNSKIFTSVFLMAIMFFSISIPSIVSAEDPVPDEGLVPCGTKKHPERCTICHLFVLAQRIIAKLTSWIFVTAVVVIAIAGVIYIVSVGNQTMTSMAKTAIKSALLGSTIILVAWLTISTIMLAMSLKNEGVSKDGKGLILQRASEDDDGKPVGIITSWKFVCK